jgi:hypothetical protein
MSRTNQADFHVRPHGSSIWTFEPKTESAKSFVRTDLDVQGWQWLGPAFGVDHRLANDLIAALEVEGFVVEL